MPEAKCNTGNMRATHMSHDGAVDDSGMKIPDKNSSGKTLAFTTAGAASALGITTVMANPNAQNV
jgi:hypothetical protein